MEHGYAVGTRQIAALAGVTQPLLLHHFGSKDGLFDAVIDRALERLLARQTAAFTHEADDLDFVLHGLRMLVQSTLDDPALLRLAAWARLAGRSPYTPGAATYWQWLTSRFETAQRSGVLRRDLPATSLLIILDAAVKGFAERAGAYAAVEVRLKAGGPPVRSLGDALFDVLLQGVLAPEALAEARQRLECP